MKLISKQSVTEEGGSTVVRCEYEADFWEGPVEAGQKGRYVRRRCSDVWFSAKGRFLNTAPSVSYYSELRKAVG